MQKQENRPDFFDGIMSHEIFEPLRPFYKRWKEQLLYLFFGGLTTVLSVALFWLLTRPLAMDALAANAVGWCLCVAFAYVTNRTWVFCEKARGGKAIARECAAFYVGRLGTLLLEELLLWLGIKVLGLTDMAVKLVSQVFVILANYAISKWFVFKGERKR